MTSYKALLRSVALPALFAALSSCGYNPNFVGAKCATTKPYCPNGLTCNVAGLCMRPDAAVVDGGIERRQDSIDDTGGTDGIDAPIAETGPTMVDADGPEEAPVDAMMVDAPDAGDGPGDVPAPACSAGAPPRSCADDGLMGPCAKGVETCIAGAWSSCSIMPKTADTCESSGNDDNCNGKPNDNCVPQCIGHHAGDKFCMGTGVYQCDQNLMGMTLVTTCVAPTPACMGGVCGTCVLNATRSCAEDGLMGPCAKGTETCGSSGAWGACSTLPGAGDTCASGNDDNCNGKPNENCKCINGDQKTCAIALGSKGTCGLDTATCLSGEWTGCANSKGLDNCEPGNDNNCNGTANEGCKCINGDQKTCAIALGSKGACGLDTATCLSGQWTGCVNSKGPDSCEPGNDNNCNGTANEGCKCTDGDQKTCAVALGSKGACGLDPATCTNGQWTGCSTSKGTDTCVPGNDNNCNGTANEGCKCTDGEQKTCAVALGSKGACGSDLATCMNGQWTGCVTSKGTDTCDLGNDNSCDGIVNGNCTCINGTTGNCGDKLAAKGTCATGTTGCANGAWGACSVSAKATDSCAAGNDDSCDGEPYTGCQCGGFTMPNPATAGLPNPASYTDNGDGTVTDNVTGLVWERNPNPTTTQCTGTGGTATTTFSAALCTQPEAVKYCSDRGPAWRLPTRLELVSLMDVTVAAPGPTINQAKFPGTPGQGFWTSSPLAGNSGSAWRVNFFDGYTINNDVTFPSRVRCVRSAVPKCYSIRYQPQTGGVVYDAATRLTWQQTSDPMSYLWNDAKAHCAGLGGGWRLPSMTELQTIVDDSRSSPSIDPIAFPGTPWATASEAFWTSSPVATGGVAWTVGFSDGRSGSRVVSDTLLRVRCVR